MKAKNAARYERGLGAALDRLRLVDSGDREAVWQATFEALMWLYSCREVERLPNKVAYYADCRRSDDGKALEALVWLRGRVAHGEADFEDVGPVPWTWGGEPWTWGGEPFVWGDGFRWRSRSELPPGRASYDRDVHYENFVQGRPLMPPLERAAEYLLGR